MDRIQRNGVTERTSVKMELGIIASITSTVLFLSFSGSSLAQDVSNGEIFNELRKLKQREEKPEKELNKKNEIMRTVLSDSVGSAVIKPAETELEKSGRPERVNIAGVVEVEYAKASRSLKDHSHGIGKVDMDNSDLTLATVELGIEAEINKYSSAQILLLYEEDDTEDFTIDEAFIGLGGLESMHGFYLMAGKFYLRFGEFYSSFVSDPLTLEIFETRESALQAGIDREWFSLGAGVFHGNVEKSFETESRMNGFFADARIHPPEDILSGVSMLLGLSYMKNIADSDTLQEEIQDINGDGITNDLEKQINGVAAYFIVEYENYGFSAEYITALHSFKPGEMGYTPDRLGNAAASDPGAWNFEFTSHLSKDWLLGIRYEGSNDMYGLFPEKQFGIMAGWQGLPNLTVSGEYLHGEYDENNRNPDGLVEDERDLFTLQFAVEF